ncbi:hypothetical protein IFM89_038675 [Coptis chinensis]|uniref:Cytochrome P450 n=1 Tax=Coptis chinensis TaxID=261450 RepID=A0A835IAE3_9MAGN|nr:hypothetical protein IFM89_038675 [Coptis chinensis]
MEFMGYPETILAVVCFLFLHHLSNKSLPTNWPFIGMLPALALNSQRVHDWSTYILSQTGCTFWFKGPWFANMNLLCTSDPANMRHIFSTNFSNYPKGTEFKEFFDILGDGIFNSDFESWKTQRKTAHQLINNKKFQSFLEETSSSKVQNGLIPVLEHVLEQNRVVDLQDLFKRFTFDNTIILLSGIDPGSLSIEFNTFPYAEALDDAEEAIFYRHIMPTSCWKFKRLLGIGTEKKTAKLRRVSISS